MLYGFLVALVFNLNQDTMKFPIQNGVIASKDVLEKNGSLSVTIKINADSTIYSCSSGKVTSILITSDNTYAIAVENVDKSVYLYANLDRVNIFKHQKIEKGQIIGIKEKKQNDDFIFFQSSAIKKK